MPQETTLGIRARLELPYEQTVDKVTEIDVKSTLKKKLDVDFRRYVILGACNPPLAHRALSTELDIGLLMPCNVIVYEDGSGSVVSIADPNAMVEMTGSTELAGTAAEARAKLEAVIDAVGA